MRTYYYPIRVAHPEIVNDHEVECITIFDKYGKITEGLGWPVAAYEEGDFPRWMDGFKYENAAYAWLQKWTKIWDLDIEDYDVIEIEN